MAGIQVTPEQHARLVQAVRECREDPAEFLARLYKINTKQQPHPIRPLRLDPVARPGQWRVYQEERRLLRERGEALLYVLKGRRAGITTLQQGLNFHAAWSGTNVDVWTFLHTEAKAAEMFEITRLARREFPSALLPETGRKDTLELSFPRRGSYFRIGTAGSTNLARGSSINRAHVSELAHASDPIAFLGALEPATENIVGRVVILETTASGYGSDPHELWRLCRDGKSLYRPVFIPWWECRPLDYRLVLEAPDELGRLEDDERALVERHGLTLEQIKWRRSRMQGAGGRSLFLTEYAEDDEGCWAAAGGLYFDADTLRILHAMAQKPAREQSGRDPALYADETSAESRGGKDPAAIGELREGERAIIGCDPAEGSGGDRSAWIIRALPSWRPVASFGSDRIEPAELGRQLAEWGRRLGNALIVVERNSHGITVLRELRDERYPDRRIYHQPALATSREKAGAKMGWHTSATSKGVLLDTIAVYLREASEGTCGAPIVEAVNDGFSVHRNAKGGVDTNGRDFLVAEGLARLGLEAPHSDHLGWGR